MKGDTLIALYDRHHVDDWFLLETDQGLFELRMGGYKKTLKDAEKSRDVIELPFYSSKITKISTDEESLYFDLDSGHQLYHGPTFITGDGELFFELGYLTREEVIRGYDQPHSDLREIIDV